MVPLVRDINPLGTQKTVSLDVEEEDRLERSAGKLKNFQAYSRRRDMAGISPIRRKTLSNQSIQN